MTDAGIDAPNDGVQPEAAFEVIYGDDWRVAVDSTNDGWFLIVANGTIEPDLSTIQVVSVSDAHPIALVRVNAFPSTGTILHGRAAGKISVDNNMVYQQIIMEPRERIDEGFLSLQTLDAPGGDYIFSVHLELSINGIQFPLDFKIHHVDTLVTYNSPETAKRLKVYP